MQNYNPQKTKMAIGYVLMLLGFIGMFLGGYMGIYNPVFHILTYGGIALMFVGILMIVINYTTEKIYKHQAKNRQSK